MKNKKESLFEILLIAFCDPEIKEMIEKDYKFFSRYLKEIYEDTNCLALEETIDIILKLDDSNSIELVRNAIEECFDNQLIKKLIVEKEKQLAEKE